MSTDSSHTDQTRLRLRAAVSRRDMLLAGTSALATAGLISAELTTPAQAQQPAPAAPGGRRPNILIIMGDDIGYWNISAYSRGMMGYRTPNIDRIAREGAIFTDLYAQQSCTAGRAAFITGQSCFRTGLLKVGVPAAKEGLSDKDPTLAELLKPMGYATGQFGKNHLGDRNEFLPTVNGFDEFFGNLYGRAGVYLLQAYCRQLGIGASAPEVRHLAESLRALPPDHPLVPLLRNAPDFQDEAALADALLNPQDRPYSVPQLFDFIDRAGLQFGRWVRQAAYLPQCGALATSPHQPLLTRLPARAQYAAVELFRGTMVRHSALVYRNDRPANTQPVRFDDDTWLDYVPIPLPDTICLQQRLPPGAAAVLINQTHTYTDLYLPIDTQQKQVFDSIDGEHTIGVIVRKHGDPDTARALFERLWWYDQVVFDARRH
jgi:hypothetical protein